MQCSGCGQAVSVPRGYLQDRIRCITCGTVVLLTQKRSDDTAQASGRPLGHHSYRTPYGRLQGQLQPNGLWAVAVQLTVRVPEGNQLAQLVENLSAAVRDITAPSLPKLNSVRSAELVSVWTVGTGPGLLPMSTLGVPLPEPVVRSIVLSVAVALQKLQEQALAAFDLSPAAIFCRADGRDACIVPSPWLASLARLSPSGVTQMPFVAPELADKSIGNPDSIAADVYGLGTLAWYLLTGTDPRKHTGIFPSDLQPSSTAWDAFVDGCCRSTPARRFRSIEEAVAAIGPGSQVSRPWSGESGIPAEAPPAGEKHRLSGRLPTFFRPPPSSSSCLRLDGALGPECGMRSN